MPILVLEKINMLRYMHLYILCLFTEQIQTLLDAHVFVLI